MNLRLKLRFRAVTAAMAGLVLLLESADSEIVRSGFEAWATMVNLFIALFGAGLLLQSYFLVRQLQAARTK